MLDSLSGIWSGVSTPFKKDGDQTVWRECSLTFSPPNKIVGEGSSVWRDKTIPFKIQGTWDLSSGSFVFFKTHIGEYTNKLEFRGKLDTSSGEFQGQYRSGNFSLRRTRGFPRKKSLKEIDVARESKVRPDEADWDEDPEMSSPKSEGISFLSGNWQGTYTLKSDSHKKTTWRNCHFEFAYENGQGKIRGSGESVWNEEVVPFKVTGTFDLKQQWVSLIKAHTQTYKTLTYNLFLDLKQLMMRGESSHGSLVLTKERIDKPKKSEPYVEFDKSMIKLPPEPVVTSPSRSSKSSDPTSSSSPSLPSKDSFGTQPAPSGRCSLSPSSRSRGSFYESTDRIGGGKRFNDVALERIRRSGVRDNDSGVSFAVRSDLDLRMGSGTVLSSSRSSSGSAFDVKHADHSDSTLGHSEERTRVHDMYKDLINRFIETNKRQSESESDTSVTVSSPEISDSSFSKKQIEALANFRSRHHLSDEDHEQVLTDYRLKKSDSVSPRSAQTDAEEFATILQSKRSYEQDLGSDEQAPQDDKPKSSIYGTWYPKAHQPSVVVPTAVVQPAPVVSMSEDDDVMPELAMPASLPSLPPPLPSSSTSEVPQLSPPRERQSSSDSEQLSERDTCIVCFNARIDCVILPCGHLAICLSCCSELDLCPLCRGSIRYAQKIFRA